MNKTDNWRPFFIFVLASSFFLLAGPASPLLVIIPVFITLLCAKFYRRIVYTFPTAHFPLRQGNSSQREKTDHTFIQWLFPTDEPSRSVPNSPVLRPNDVVLIKESEVAQA